MSNEMIERVAKAFYEKTCTKNMNGIINQPWDGFNDLTKSYYWEIAKAAIAAMREPTEEMISAGVVNNDVDFGVSRECYQAMIDAALKEG